MSSVSLRWEANAFLGFFERQRNLYRRYWLWEVVWFVYSMVSVLSIGYLAEGLSGQTLAPAQLQRIQLYLLVGSVLWGYLSMVFFEVSFAISWERWEGTIEYTFMAPVRRVTHLLGVTCFGVLYGLVRTALIVVVMQFAFHLNFSNADFWSAGIVIAVATLPIVGIGIYTSMLPLLSPEKGDQMGVAVQGVLLLVSGVYYPITVLPLALQFIGRVSPLTYTLDAIRHALLDNAGISGLLPTLGLLVAMGTVLVASGLYVFGLAERRAKKLGLLKRNG